MNYTVDDLRTRRSAEEELLELKQWLDAGCPFPMPDSVARDQAQAREAHLEGHREEKRFERARFGYSRQARGPGPSGIMTTQIYAEMNWPLIPTSRSEGRPSESTRTSVANIYRELNRRFFSLDIGGSA